jgi:hypothetical protein
MRKISSWLLLMAAAINGVSQIQFKSGMELAKFMFDQLDKTLVMDESTVDKVAQVFNLTDANANDLLHITHRPANKNYYLEYGFNFGNEACQNMQVDAFYDEGVAEQAVQEAQEILKYVQSLFGDPTYGSTDYFTWDREKYSVEVGTYENGWGVYIYSHNFNFMENDLNCEGKEGDFSTLTNELFTLFFDQLKIDQPYNKITSQELVSYTGNGEYFSNEYAGIFVEGSYVYVEGELSEIWFDYFYDCPETIIHLDADANELKKLIMERTQVTATVTQNDGVMDYLWKFSSFELKLSQYYDGYGFYVMRVQK